MTQFEHQDSPPSLSNLLIKDTTATVSLQRREDDCVPSVFLNILMLNGKALPTKYAGTEYDRTPLRNILDWERSGYIDMHSLPEALAKGGIKSHLRIISTHGGHNPTFKRGDQIVSQDSFTEELLEEMKKENGVVLGYGDHVRIFLSYTPGQNMQTRICMIDSFPAEGASPVQSLTRESFSQWIRDNTPLASLQGEHPVTFDVLTSPKIRFLSKYRLRR